jgi:predicted dehydrogenase
VIGDRRMAVFDDVSTQEPIRVYDRGVDRDKSFAEFAQFQLMLRDGDIHIPHIEIEEPLRVECAHFIECIRTGRRPRTDGSFGLAVVRVLEALGRSLRRRGRPVKVH